jgi:sorting nexin-16
MQRQKNNKESVSSSCPNISSNSHSKGFPLKRSKSESDIKTITTPTKNLKQHAKSERNLESLYSNFTSSSPSSNFLSRGNPMTNIMQSSTFSVIADQDLIKVPIIGYEVMEERSRFTIFKLRIENYEKNNFWMVLRRFTDFTRLHTKLRTLYPEVNLMLPKKKWFGNNFSTGFLDTRIAGLQTFINTILSSSEMKRSPVVREFFCLDDPPLYSESMEECKAIFEAQEETIAHMKMQLKIKDEMIGNLAQELHVQKQQNEYLMSLVK